MRVDEEEKMRILIEEYGQTLLGLLAGSAVIKMVMNVLDYVTSF